jgi:adenosine deaminase
VFPDLASHSLGQLLSAGIAATVNSDDPAYFGGYMNDNFTQTFAALPLGAAEAYTLARNSFEASFIEPSAKQAFINQLDDTFATFR